MKKSITSVIATVLILTLALSACSHASGSGGSGDSGTGTGTGGSTTTPGGTVDVQGSVVFTKGDGWFEYAFAEWNAVAGATAYKVYYKQSTASAYTPVDAALVRATKSGGTAVGGTYTGDRANLVDGVLYNGSLDGGTRVDIPGLKGGVSYNVKVVPVIGGSENESAASVLSVTTLAHDRSGFAFHASSPTKKTTGGYQLDGTASATAAILYLTEESKDTLQLAVTKGSTPTTWTGISAIMKARESASSTVPLIVRVIGKVTNPSGITDLLDIKANQNVTFEGIGYDAMLNGWGLNVRGAVNIEIRNLAFYDFADDSVSVQVDNSNIWIHHNDLMVGKNMGGDKALGDGSCDIKDNSSYITVSYNHFRGTGKSSLTGMSDTAEFFVTFHHNYFDHIGSRGPRTRWGTVHIYNNYYKDVGTYGSAASHYSNLFIQNNVYENVVRPMIIASQGHDMKSLVPAGMTPGPNESILSGELGGRIKQSGNVMDAYSASWFDAAVDTGNGSSGAYNNFDSGLTSAVYPHALHTAEFGKEMVLAFAGTINKGTGATTVPEKTAAQKVAAAKLLLENLLVGLFYTDQVTTEMAVSAAISEAEIDFDDPVVATMVTNDSAKTVTITIISGDSTDTIVVRAQTADEKIAVAAAAVETAVEEISYTNVTDTLVAVNSAINALAYPSGVSVDAADVSGDIVVFVSCAGGTTVTVTLEAPTDAERVAHAKASVNSAIAGIAYTVYKTASSVQIEVDAAIALLSEGAKQGCTISISLGGPDVLVSIYYNAASDSVLKTAPTDANRVAVSKATATSAIDGIDFVPGDTAAAVQAEVDAVLSACTFALNSTAVTTVTDGNVVITILAGATSDTITILKPTDTAYVAAAKSNLLANPAVVWNTDAATTLAAANAAIAGALFNGASASAVVSGSSVVITISYGTAASTITLASSVTYRFNASLWAAPIASFDSNFFATACTFDSSLSGIITVAAEANSKFRAYAVTASLADADGTMNFTKAISLRESVSTITVAATPNDLITLVYADANVAPLTLSGITTEIETNTFTVSGCTATSYRVSGTGTLILGKNQAARLCAIIVTQYN